MIKINRVSMIKETINKGKWQITDQNKQRKLKNIKRNTNDPIRENGQKRGEN